jgi:hypothetical protein
MFEIEDNLCFDNESIGLNEATIDVQYVQNLANDIHKERQLSENIIIDSEEVVIPNDSQMNNFIDLTESEYSSSNESKRRKIQRKKISKRFKRGNKITVQMRVNE